MSRAYCESYEMQLVSVETEEEDQAITNLWLMSSSGKFESGQRRRLVDRNEFFQRVTGHRAPTMAMKEDGSGPQWARTFPTPTGI